MHRPYSSFKHLHKILQVLEETYWKRRSLFWLQPFPASSAITALFHVSLLAFLLSVLQWQPAFASWRASGGLEPLVKYGVRSPKFFGLHVTLCAQLYSLAETLQLPSPPPPAFGLVLRGRYWSAKIDDISLHVTPWLEPIKTATKHPGFSSSISCQCFRCCKTWWGEGRGRGQREVLKSQ
jgi:hypothetical protein